MARAKSLAVDEPPKPAPYERTYRRIECDLEKYQGYWAEFWIDYPMYVPLKIERAAQSGSMDAMLDAFRGHPVIASWNLVDYEGNLLPVPSEDPESLYKIPGPLMGWVFNTIASAGSLGQDDELGNSEKP